MLEVGVREFKARLSYYVQRMQAGETIAISIRNQVVGFLTQKNVSQKKGKIPKIELLKKILQLKQEGFLNSGGLCKHRPIKPIKLKQGIITTEMLHQMRDEEWK